MGDDDRVVLRSPWRAEVLNMAPIAVVFTAFTAWSRDIVSLVTVAVALVLMTVLFHYLSHVVLTRTPSSCGGSVAPSSRGHRSAGWSWRDRDSPRSA